MCKHQLYCFTEESDAPLNRDVIAILCRLQGTQTLTSCLILKYVFVIWENLLHSSSTLPQKKPTSNAIVNIKKTISNL